MIRLGCGPMEDFDRSFIRSVYDRCEGSLDLVVDGEEVGQAIGLDEAQTADVVAHLMRTGYVRDVAAHFRIQITARGIAVARLEPPSIAAVSLPGSDPANHRPSRDDSVREDVRSPSCAASRTGGSCPTSATPPGATGCVGVWTGDPEFVGLGGFARAALSRIHRSPGLIHDPGQQNRCPADRE